MPLVFCFGQPKPVLLFFGIVEFVAIGAVYGLSLAMMVWLVEKAAKHHLVVHVLCKIMKSPHVR
jgi:hypothetical protein